MITHLDFSAVCGYFRILNHVTQCCNITKCRNHQFLLNTLWRHWVMFPSGCDLDTQTCGGWNWDMKALGWKQSWGIKRENGWCYCNIFLFLAFLAALNWPTFYRKSACTFFLIFMSHEPTELWMCFLVSLNLLKCETLYFVQCIFNLYFFLIVVPYEAPLYWTIWCDQI